MAKPQDITLDFSGLQPKQFQLRMHMYAKGLDAATVVGAGGAKAGGKSYAVRKIMLERCWDYPGTSRVILRRTWKDLKDSHVEKFQAEYPQLTQFYRASDHDYIFPNGSKLSFRFADTYTDVKRIFQSVEWYDIAIDEAQQFTEQEIQWIKTTNRWADSAPGECKMLLTFNPEGIGSEYLRRVFWLKQFNSNERAGNFVFLHLLGWDNYEWFTDVIPEGEFYKLPDGVWETLCPYGEEGNAPDYKCCRFHLFVNRTSYGAELNSLPTATRIGFLIGSFEKFGGQYFAGVWDEPKIILDTETTSKLIQPWWERWIAHDDGFGHFAAITWAARGKVTPLMWKNIWNLDREEMEAVVIYRSYAVQGREPGDLVEDVRAKTTLEEAKTLGHYFLAVDAAKKQSISGHSVKEVVTDALMKRERVFDEGKWLDVYYPMPEKPANAREEGWRYLYSMMKKTCDVFNGKENAYGINKEIPLLFVAGAECQDIQYAIPLAVRDDTPGKWEDIIKRNTKADDVLDSLRYAVLSIVYANSIPHDVAKAQRWEELSSQGMSPTGLAMQMKRMDSEKRKILSRRSLPGRIHRRSVN